MKIRHIWTENEINFLKMYYTSSGVSYCAFLLNLNTEQVRQKARSLKIPIQKTNIDIFKMLNNKEVVYLMGLLWADGFLSNKKSKMYVNLSIIEEDGLKVEKIIKKLYNNCRIYHQQRNNKPQIIFRINNKELVELFDSYGYGKKSTISPDILLSKIHEDLLHYFYRGLIDGDGCFYVNKNTYNYQFVLASTFEQDWSYFEKLCKKLNIQNYSIVKTDKEKSKSSCLRITSIKNIKKLGSYIYKNFETDGIGLDRKYKKWQEIDAQKISKPIKLKNEDLFVLAKEGITIGEICKLYNYTVSTLNRFINKSTELKTLFNKNSPKRLTNEEKNQIIKMIKDKISNSIIMNKYNIKKSTLWNMKQKCNFEF